MYHTVLIFILTFISISLHGRDISVQSGNWENNATWNNNTPTTQDTIIIESGHVITIDNSNLTYTPNVVIILRGEITFDGGKLRLSATSTIISENGVISSTDGNNNDKISFGNTNVWTSNDGSLTGEFILDINGIVTVPIIWTSIELEANDNTIDITWSTYNTDSVIDYTISVYNSEFDCIHTVVTNSTKGDTYKINANGTPGWNYVKICEKDIHNNLECSDLFRIFIKDKETRYIYYVTPQGHIYYTQPNGFSIGITTNYERHKKIKN